MGVCLNSSPEEKAVGNTFLASSQKGDCCVAGTYLSVGAVKGVLIPQVLNESKMCLLGSGGGVTQ